MCLYLISLCQQVHISLELWMSILPCLNFTTPQSMVLSPIDSGDLMAIFKVVQAWLCSSTCAGIWLQLCPAILTILNTLNIFVAMLFLQLPWVPDFLQAPCEYGSCSSPSKDVKPSSRTLGTLSCVFLLPFPCGALAVSTCSCRLSTAPCHLRVFAALIPGSC